MFSQTIGAGTEGICKRIYEIECFRTPIQKYSDEIKKAGMVLWNGPTGKFEDKPYSKGTRALAEAMASSGAVTIVGGGETAEAVEEFGLADKMTHVSTGGGAFLEYIEGTSFPALAEIEEN